MAAILKFEGCWCSAHGATSPIEAGFIRLRRTKMTNSGKPELDGRGRFAPGDANGSRERAPDDRLRIVQGKSGEGAMDYERP